MSAKLSLSVTPTMLETLENERKRRQLSSIQELIRDIIYENFVVPRGKGRARRVFPRVKNAANANTHTPLPPISKRKR
jgi:hypothetical protein